MIKVLAIGASLALGFGVAHAQSKKPRKRPAAGDKVSKDAQPAMPAPTPATTPASTPTLPGGRTGTAGATTGGAAAPATAPAATAPIATPAAAAAAKAGAAPAKPPTPMKTDEKAGTQLDRRGSGGDYRNVTADNERQALEKFRDGNNQLNDGFFVKAVDSYRQALGFWDHPAIHYNMALALINLDQPIEVHEHLNRALQYGAEPLEKDKYDHGKEYLRLVEGQLANIEVTCEKPGAKVSVDGKEVFTAPGKYSAKVRVGQHTFHAEKEGYNARINAPFVGPGETYRLELKVYTADELTRHRRKWDRTWVPYTVIGAGALIGVAGGLMQLSAQSSYDDYNEAVARCNTPAMACSSSDTTITKLRDDGDTKRTLGYVGYGIAGTAIATGVVLAWLNRREAYQVSPDEIEGLKPQSPIAVTPIVSPEVMGAMVQGKF